MGMIIDLSIGRVPLTRWIQKNLARVVSSVANINHKKNYTTIIFAVVIWKLKNDMETRYKFFTFEQKVRPKKWTKILGR
jgi:hypothetical protein